MTKVTRVEFIEEVYELCFGDDAINRNFTREEVLTELRRCMEIVGEHEQ